MFHKVLSSGLTNRYTSHYHEEYILDRKSDISEIPTDCAPGSFAYTADLGTIFQLSPSHEWVEVVTDDAITNQ